MTPEEFYESVAHFAEYYKSAIIIPEIWDFTFAEYMEESLRHSQESTNKPMVFTAI